MPRTGMPIKAFPLPQDVFVVPRIMGWGSFPK